MLLYVLAYIRWCLLPLVSRALISYYSFIRRQDVSLIRIIKDNNMDVLGRTGVIPNTESRKPRQDVEAFLVLKLLFELFEGACE